ncbi:hypothetical protein BDB00DRAFT_937536 [Zychaea mexicana]|uniref:uncharacterized protein n=1 Tax=Zychaea mexicana TaxID=64656 RepID=UPI0022FEFC2D|nr:uncharacterized protein BDB00DRAFT_937536 [Zychaea mexicana]KAI9495756.1 hypothetical protein BDB00DRAFT_937536 [Zychaea mexicana]
MYENVNTKYITLICYCIAPPEQSVDDFLTEAGWIVWAQRLEETKILNLELTAVKGVTGAVLEHFEQVESSVLLRVSRIYSLTNAGINAFRIIEGSNPGLMERQHDVDLVGSESGALSNLSESTD